MDQAARAAAEAAGERARQLAERRERLLSGAGSTDDDVREATLSAALSLWRAKSAHMRSGLAHDRAAIAHDRAAAAKEAQAIRATEPDSTVLLAEAEAHRRAARDDREAAHRDRSLAAEED
ncbi:hypothetical protein GCM10027053_06760 [Intrasporangium mesophilum]